MPTRLAGHNGHSRRDSLGHEFACLVMFYGDAGRQKINRKDTDAADEKSDDQAVDSVARFAPSQIDFTAAGRPIAGDK